MFIIPTMVVYKLYNTPRLVSQFLKIGDIKSLVPTRNMASNRKVKFDVKHLAKGDALPPYKGKLRVYNMRYCPYAQRLILALNAKNIDYDIVNVDLVNKPDWLFDKSAFGKVPALEIRENSTIYESLVTVEYLDEVYPQRPLLPKDPELRAYDKIIVEASASIHAFLFKFVKFPDKIDEAIPSYHKALDFIQAQLEKRGTKFLDGSEPGFADYMIWPWFERLLVFKDERATIDPKKYKLLREYLDNMLKDPVVNEYLLSADRILAFMDSYIRGAPNYNMVMEDYD